LCQGITLEVDTNQCYLLNLFPLPRPDSLLASSRFSTGRWLADIPLLYDHAEEDAVASAQIAYVWKQL